MVLKSLMRPLPHETDDLTDPPGLPQTAKRPVLPIHVGASAAPTLRKRCDSGEQRAEGRQEGQQGRAVVICRDSGWCPLTWSRFLPGVGPATYDLCVRAIRLAI